MRSWTEQEIQFLLKSTLVHRTKHILLWLKLDLFLATFGVLNPKLVSASSQESSLNQHTSTLRLQS